MTVRPHETETVTCVGCDTCEEEDPKFLRHFENRYRRPESDMRPHDGTRHAEACIENDGHVVFLGDEIPRGVEHSGSENQKKGKE